jgi:glycosyltransferase involved in cell wall biosynthesis
MIPLKLMILGDSPTRETGFARVVRNLLAHWIKAGVFAEIHVWGIGYWGFPHSYPPHVKIYPAAGPQDQRWDSTENLSRFAKVLAGNHFTHCFLIQDVWGLASLGLLLRRMAGERGMRTLLYFPVDAPLDPHWVEIVASVTVPVAYCEYGRAEACRALLQPVGDDELDPLRAEAAGRIRVLPHGVDACFKPDDGSGEAQLMRKKITTDGITDEDMLLLNVSTHQRRKGLAQTLQIWACLRAMTPRRVFLYLHCEAVNGGEGSSLALVAQQLGLAGEIGQTLFFGHESYFIHGRPTASDHHLNLIYNAADVLVSTSLGEGWGLPLTEAMRAGLSVAAPNHTSCREILMIERSERRGLLLPLVGQADMVIGDNSRLRRRVDAEAAAFEIDALSRDGERIAGMQAAAGRWVRSPEMQWETIAGQWLQLMEVR